MSKADGIVSIHAPLARSNMPFTEKFYTDAVSIHAPLARSNFSEDGKAEHIIVSIHAPLARSNSKSFLPPSKVECFNTCSSCEEQHFIVVNKTLIRVSIHAPLARSNTPMYSSLHSARSVSIHAPLARSNLILWDASNSKFCFNTCSSCEEQLYFRRRFAPVISVSIHAPLARSNSPHASHV